MMLCDLHKIMKSVTKFWNRIKRTDRSHRCSADTNNDKIVPWLPFHSDNFEVKWPRFSWFRTLSFVILWRNQFLTSNFTFVVTHVVYWLYNVKITLWYIRRKITRRRCRIVFIVFHLHMFHCVQNVFTPMLMIDCLLLFCFQYQVCHQ